MTRDNMEINGIIDRGISYYKEHKYSEAIECFNQVISDDPKCVQAYHYRALIRRRQKDNQEALEDLQEAARLLNDREYTNISKNLQNFIGPGCSKKTEDLESYSEYNLIFHNENWFESYYDLVDAFPDEFISYLDIDLVEVEEYTEQTFQRLECWLSMRLKHSHILQKKRIQNAKFDLDRLQSKNLPFCNSHEEIAQAMGISVKGLRFLAFCRTKYNYTRFQIPKKTGGMRDISAPKCLLKKAQNWILKNILEKIELHNAAHGFRLKRSIVTNAEIHVGKEVIINLDLKDFFPSISYKRVKGLFKSFGYSETASIIFGLICTEPRIKEVEINGKTELLLSWTERYLPQGGPSSPAITNLLCRRLDERLSKMAQLYGFDYTRYADDLTFSASGDSLRNICNILNGSRSIVKQEDFEINEQKTRVIRKFQQQEVTGVVVNSKLNVSRETLKRFRAVLYQIEKDGLEGHNWGSSNDLIASLEGFANFVSMVNQEKGAKFKEQIADIKEKHRCKKAKVEPVSEPLLNQSNLIALIYAELDRLKWSQWEKRLYLKGVYNKHSLQQLTDEQLLEFMHDLTRGSQWKKILINLRIGYAWNNVTWAEEIVENTDNDFNF